MFKVKETKPNLTNLSTFLNSSSFNGLEYESMINPKTLYNWERLQNEIQASDHELKQALADFLIADINGNNLICFPVPRIIIYASRFRITCARRRDVTERCCHDVVRSPIAVPRRRRLAYARLRSVVFGPPRAQLRRGNVSYSSVLAQKSLRFYGSGILPVPYEVLNIS